jgi:hypothetical protein
MWQQLALSSYGTANVIIIKLYAHCGWSAPATAPVCCQGFATLLLYLLPLQGCNSNNCNTQATGVDALMLLHHLAPTCCCHEFACSTRPHGPKVKAAAGTAVAIVVGAGAVAATTAPTATAATTKPATDPRATLLQAAGCCVVDCSVGCRWCCDRTTWDRQMKRQQQQQQSLSRWNCLR